MACTMGVMWHVCLFKYPQQTPTCLRAASLCACCDWIRERSYASSSQFHWSSSRLMLLTWNSLGCRACLPRGAPTVWLRVHLQRGREELCHLRGHPVSIYPLGWRSTSPACSPKLYFVFVCSQQELNRISIQTSLTPVALSDRRCIPLL